jgi:hypothetical protein
MAQFEAFQRTMCEILNSSHGEIKAALNEEKAAKKRKKARKSSASGRASSGRA